VRYTSCGGDVQREPVRTRLGAHPAVADAPSSGGDECVPQVSRWMTRRTRHKLAEHLRSPSDWVRRKVRCDAGAPVGRPERA
jgi:hypothetical protein